MKRTKDQNKKLYAALTSRDLLDQKGYLVLEFTNGRTEKSSEMTYQECDELINSLNGQSNLSADKMRKKILWMAHELGWQYYDEDSKKLKVDLKSVDFWCINRGSYKKKLQDHSAAELTVLVSVFRSKVFPHQFKKTYAKS